MYRLDADGNVVDRDTSIYVDGFVLNGMGEYFIASGDARAAQLAAETFDNVRRRLATGRYGIAPYVLPPGTKTLGIPMIFSFFSHNLGKAIGGPEISKVGQQHAREILSDFHIPEKRAVMEFVKTDGGMIDSAEGRVTIPGHVIEAMWFIISIFEDTGETHLIPRCIEIIKRYLELGWDEPYGGIRLAVDIDGHEPVAWNKADYKPWWVQVEALVATACAWRHTGEDWCLEWHERVREWAWSHYPVPTGEWTQWLDRLGNKGESAALPVKDPFHLPRALIYLVGLLGVEG